MAGQYNSVFKPGLFSGQTIIVTGGGSGIGRCTAHELTSLGAKVVLIGRNQDKLEKVQAEIRDDGGEAAWATLDIRVEADVKRVVGEVVAEHGPIHGLVNNAGGQFPAPLALISQNGWETVVRTNLTGGFLMSREVFLQSMRNHGGAIVNIVADMYGGMAMMGHSGAARAGMVNFTESAAVEWACAGVRVNAVAPGWIASSGLDTYTDPNMKANLKTIQEKVPLKRLAEEAEVASSISFLLSPAAAYLSGITIKVDGGSTLNYRMFPLPAHKKSQPYQGFHRAVRPKILQDLDQADSSQEG